MPAFSAHRMPQTPENDALPPDPPTFPDTRPTLLQRLPDAADGEAWRAFVETYGPLIFRFAVRRGVPPADAADLLQEVLMRVARGMGEFAYDRSKGRFRGWLFTIAWRALIDRAKADKRRAEVVDDRLDERPAADADREIEAHWNEEYRRQLLRHALPLVRPQFAGKTWEAFRLTALDNRDAASVAEELGLSLGAVYIARSRVIARLREKVAQLEADWEGASTLQPAR